jgi:hypothetical protein
MTTDPPEGGGTWLSKSELARIRRISVASADRLIRREKWRKMPGNDGRIRALIPPDWLVAHDQADLPQDPTGLGTEHPTDRPVDRKRRNPRDVAADPEADPTDLARVSAAFEVATRALQEAHAAAVSTLQTGHAGEVADLRAEVEALNRQLAEARKALQGVDQLRADADARMAMGLLARLRAAWRGR